MSFVWMSEKTAASTFCTTEVGSYFYDFYGFLFTPRHTHTPNQELHMRPHFQDFIITTHYYIVFYHFNPLNTELNPICQYYK